MTASQGFPLTSLKYIACATLLSNEYLGFPGDGCHIAHTFGLERVYY